MRKNLLHEAQLGDVNPILSKTGHELILLANGSENDVFMKHPDIDDELLDRSLSDRETFVYLAAFKKGMIFGRKGK